MGEVFKFIAYNINAPLGHVDRIVEDRAAKQPYLGEPTDHRLVGHPKYFWSDEVQTLLKDLYICDRQEQVQNRA